MLNNVWPALSLSLKVAFCATLLNLLLGVAVGFVLARRRFIGRDLLDTLHRQSFSHADIKDIAHLTRALRLLTLDGRDLLQVAQQRLLDR